MAGEEINAVVIGGGPVGTRKAVALHAAGATVRVISPDVTSELHALAAANERLSIELRQYSGSADIADAELVIAATGSDADTRIAADARTLHRLVIVAGAPEAGNCTSMAIHHAGQLVVGVSAGGVPGAASRVRDAIAERFDSRYADALVVCAENRANALENAGSPEWTRLNAVLIGEDFCRRVESGAFAEAVGECR